LNGKHFFKNSAYYTSLGYTATEDKGFDDFTHVHPDDLPLLKQMLATLPESGTLTFEYRVQHRSGRWLTRYARTTLIRDDLNRPKAVLAVLRDVTERKWMEDSLVDGLAFNQTILDTVPVGILTYDADGKCLSANQAAADIIGGTIAQLLEVNFRNSQAIQELNLSQVFDSVLATGQTVERESHRTSTFGKEVWLRLHYARFLDCGEHRLLLVIQDIMQSKHAEQELRGSRERLNLALRAAEMGAWHWDIVKNLRIFDEQVCRLLGIDPATFQGKPDEFLNTVHAEDRAKVQASLARTLDQGVPYEVEYRAIWPDQSIHHISARGQLVRDEEGKPLRIHGVVWDISDRKAAEEERRSLQKQLFHTQKMESIGALAGGIAHDFNNILAVIHGAAEMASMENEASEKPANLREDLDRILRATQRAKSLVQQILSFSRKNSQEKQPLQLRSIVKETCKFMRAALPSTIELRYELPTEGPVLANSTQIHQVLMNLLTNAGLAMPEGGSIEVFLDEVESTTPLRERHPNLAHGPLMRLTVRDTGVGIPPENLDRIFEPFFTTRGEKEGTGLGLAVVHGLVAEHNGAIEVSSKVGQGTTFEVFLPRLPQASDTSTTEVIALPGTERILFVDDEHALVDLARRGLGRLGYQVQGFTSSIEALRAFRCAPDAFDIVISDVTMPGLAGDLLVREMRKLRPKIPLILLTGMSDRMSPEKAEKLGIDAFIYKPVTPVQLSVYLRQVLDGHKQ
jgi:PAS domain S-box-containing protein